MSRTLAVVGLLTIATGVVGPATRAEEVAQQAAVGAAREWLELVDTGKIDKSWETAASYFKTAVTKERWQQSVAAARGPLGKNLTREVKTATYRTTLPGAPDGEYVVIQFQSSFEHKREAVETVTPMRDRDGEWRVSGYYIK